MRAKTGVAGCSERLRPSCPERAPIPLRSKKQRRVNRARGHHDDRRPNLDLRSACHSGRCAACATALDEDPQHVRASNDARAGLLRTRDICDACVLLGRRWTAERAYARSHAAACVAPQIAMRPAQALGAETGDLRIAARQLRRHLAHRQRLLDALEARLQRLLADIHAKLTLPALQHTRRSTKARPRVDQGRAPHPTSQWQQDRRFPQRHDLAAVAIQAREHLRHPRREAVRVMPVPLLEHHNAHTALGQLGRGDRTARARTDHARIRVEAARSASVHGRPSTRRSSRPRATTAVASQPSERLTAGSS